MIIKNRYIGLVCLGLVVCSSSVINATATLPEKSPPMLTESQKIGKWLPGKKYHVQFHLKSSDAGSIHCRNKTVTGPQVDALLNACESRSGIARPLEIHEYDVAPER